MNHSIRLLIVRPDHKGITAVVSSFVEAHDGNIIRIDQYLKPPPSRRFLLRMEIEGKGFDLGRGEFGTAFGPLAREHTMDWRLSYSDEPKRMAIMVSRYEHCLTDLLWRWDTGELDVQIPLVISNHPDFASRVEAYGIPFYHLPLKPETKAEQESKILGLLAGHGIDFVVLARYMQILTPRFLRAYPARIINIHHSFLPAFAGAKPYQRAYERGVKVIGATAHYATEELDAGPITDQDVIRVTHWDEAEDMARVGQEVERRVLARAVRWHIEDRVLVDGARTIVFV
jgi:formyltetrahydrofolate deformylase